MEDSQGDIGDRLEGTSELTIKDGLHITENSPELELANQANIGLGTFGQFANVRGGGRITIAPGVSFVHQIPEVVIYSYSRGDLSALTELMCVSAPDPYDACLRIIDEQALSFTCIQEGKILILNNIPVHEIFKHIAVGTVAYVPRSVDIRDGSALAPDPFMKGERYRYQSEDRFVFVPHDGTTLPMQRLIVSIPQSERYFELVFRDYVKPTTTPATRPKPEP